MSTEVESQRYVYEELTGEEPTGIQKTKLNAMDRDAFEKRTRAAVAAMLLARDGARGGVQGHAQEGVQDDAQDGDDLSNPTPPDVETAYRKPIPFEHNPLHDLESVLWVVIWLFICSEFVEPKTNTNDRNLHAKLHNDWTRALKFHAHLELSLYELGKFLTQIFISRSKYDIINIYLYD